MKRIILPLLGGALFVLASCNGSDTGGASSTPIDSTNQTGAAPAAYQAGTPTETVSESTQQRDAATSDTTGKNQPQWDQPNGNGTNTSNTTDKRTTSGSANNGDADGDRKR